MNSFSDWSWFADILLSVYYSYFEICLLKNKIKEITSLAENNREITGMKPNSQDNVQKNEIEELKKKISDIKLEIAKLIFDLPVSYYYINDTYAHILWIGLTGTISSAIGVYQTW